MPAVTINGFVAYQPTPFQERMHTVKGRYPLVGGSAGPGKSHGLRWQGHLMALSIPQLTVLLLRRKLADLQRTHLRAIRTEADTLGATWEPLSKGGGELHYPNGSLLELGHCQYDKDVENYLSAEYDLALFDEQVTFAEYHWLMIGSRCRTTKPNYQPRVMGGTNPGVSPIYAPQPGLGANWCKRRWIDRDVTVEEDPEYREADYPYVPATLKDNPYINQDEYARQLRRLPPVLRRAYLEGSWDLFQGQFFPEFNKTVHVQERHPEPFAPRICGIDWGYAREGVCLWATVLSTGQLYIEDELTVNGPYREKLTNEGFAQAIKARTERHQRRVIGYYADPSMFSHQTGVTIVESFVKQGISPIRADNDRIHGWAKLREWLQLRPDREEPWLLISPACHQLITTLPLLVSKENDPEDCAKREQPDHWADALRYLVAGRPSPQHVADVVIPPVGTAGWMKRKILNAAGQTIHQSRGAASRMRKRDAASSA